MKMLISIILTLFLIQSCSGNYTNGPDSEKEQVSESELEFNDEIDFIYDHGSDDDNNEFDYDSDSEDSLTSV